MKKTSGIFTMGAVTGFLLLGACGGGGAPAFDAESPAGQAYLYRQSVMTLAANKMAMIGGMAREEIPLDEAAFVQATADLAALAGMTAAGFEMPGIVGPSRSLPVIWEDEGDFAQKTNDFVEATAGLAEAAASGGFAAAQGLVQGTAGTCGGCHRTYRERTE